MARPTALAVPMPVPGDDVVELRLALVLYGGVSLAIYMHGVTKEIHNLVIGSTELESDAAPTAGGVVAAYHALLDRLRHEPVRDEGGAARTRVVVDVVAGTSAGGVNGVVLAKALAQDASQDSLRGLWLDEADIGRLVDPTAKRQLPGIRAALPHLRAVFPSLGRLAGLPAGSSGDGRRLGRPRQVLHLLRAGFHLRGLVRDAARGGSAVPVSVLDGPLMSRLAHDVLRTMPPRTEGAARGSLLPPDHLIELCVTATDYAGWQRFVPIERQTIRDVNHRHVFRFEARGPSSNGRAHAAGDDDFVPSADGTGMLAFAARATASFPGAFPPISLADFAREAGGRIGWEEGTLRRHFRPYQLDGVDPGTRRFLDGGLLDNMPFDHAIKAIRAKPASTQVKRRLLYIDPDPDEERSELPGLGTGGAPPPVPSLLAGSKQALSAIPLQQSVLDELLVLREANENARRVRDVVDRNFDDVGAAVKAIEAAPGRSGDPDALPAWWQEIDLPSNDTGSYLRLKIGSVVEAFSDAICRRCEYPPESNYAFFVRAILRHWAEAGGLYEHAGDKPSPRQVEFLGRFDVGYRRRRVRFLIDGVSGLYAQAGSPGYPQRRELDTLKQALYERIATLERALDAASEDDELERLAAAVFPQSRLRRLLPPPEALSGWRLADRIEELEAKIRPDLDALAERLGALLEPTLANFNALTMRGLLERLETVTLPDEERRKLVVRFAGYPRWDPLTYPLRVLGDVGELDIVQVVRLSPRETRELRRPDAGAGPADLLRGATVRHFGAFFERSFRENDYLWGRLDAAEQLIGLLSEEVLDDDRRARLRAQACAEAFAAILDEERPRLTAVAPLLAELDRQVAALASRAAVQPVGAS